MRSSVIVWALSCAALGAALRLAGAEEVEPHLQINQKQNMNQTSAPPLPRPAAVRGRAEEDEGEEEDPTRRLSNCPNTCYGDARTCASHAPTHTKSQITHPTPSPTRPHTRHQRTCPGGSCQYWIEAGFGCPDNTCTCESFESAWACDCAGCPGCDAVEEDDGPSYSCPECAGFGDTCDEMDEEWGTSSGKCDWNDHYGWSGEYGELASHCDCT